MDDLIKAGTPWWLIVILLVLGVGVPAAGSERAATLPSILGAGARWWQGRRARRRAEAVAEAQAAAELTPSERLSDKEIARMDDRYERLAKDCREDVKRATEANGRLLDRVDRLEARITTSERRFYVLLGHYRVVADSHRANAPGVPLPAAPEELREFIA